MFKKILIVPIVALTLATSCVPAKKFADLETKYDDLEAKSNSLQQKLDNCEEESVNRRNEFEQAQKRMSELQTQNQGYEEKFRNLEELYDNLQESYNALESNSSNLLQDISKQNRTLLGDLENKQNALAKEKQRLQLLEEDLKSRSQRIDELETILAAKDAKMKALKQSVSNALTNFEGKGLTVEQRNGKVYVSMENKLLFSSGSWAVGEQGQQAVKQLAAVLAENNDINVLIEGHTDNVPYGGNGALQNNWDLSTKRATSIVNLLQQNGRINAERLTAAGRGEYAPIASNSSAEGKAKNRRIEVILTPKYDELSRLLSEENRDR